MDNIKKRIPHSFNRSALALTGVLSLAFILNACTKSLPYETITKENTYSKATIDTNSEYLYIPSTGAISKNNTGPNVPYYLMGQKIVKLKFTEKTLRAYEVPLDPTLKQNEKNNKLVLEIPVEHLDYR